MEQRGQPVHLLEQTPGRAVGACRGRGRQARSALGIPARVERRDSGKGGYRRGREAARGGRRGRGGGRGTADRIKISRSALISRSVGGSASAASDARAEASGALAARRLAASARSFRRASSSARPPSSNPRRPPSSESRKAASGPGGAGTVAGSSPASPLPACRGGVGMRARQGRRCAPLFALIRFAAVTFVQKRQIILCKGCKL